MRKQLKLDGKRKLNLNKKAIAMLNLNGQQTRLFVGGNSDTISIACTDTILTVLSSVKLCTTLTQLPTD